MEDDIILPEGFDMPQPEGTEPVEQVQETMDESVTHETGEDTTPPETTETPEVTEPQKIRVKFNHEERELSVEEAAQLAQKGMNYEKAVERARQEAAQQAKDAVIAEMGWRDFDGNPITTEARYREVMREKEIRDKYSDLPDEVRQELIASRMDREERQREKQAKESEAKQQAEFKDFFDYFQDANGRAWDPAKDSIPAEVQEAVSKGVPLKFAYMEHHNKQLANQLKIQTQNKTNKAKAPVGGVTVNGGTPPVSEDLFLKGFNSI